MCKCTAKVILAVLAIVFWLAAGGLIFIGAYVYSGYQNFSQIANATYTLLPATIIIAVGVFFFILGIVGCIGAVKEQKCLLGLFFTFLLLIFVGLVAGAILAYVYREDVDKALKTGIDDCMENYGNMSSKFGQVCKTEVDFMQKTLTCCGSDNYTSWLTTNWYHQHEHANASYKYPESCCDGKECHYDFSNSTSYVYSKGCGQKMETLFMDHLGIIAGVMAGFAMLQLLGMIFSCVLICVKRRDSVPYIGLNEPSGMRV